MGLGRLLLNLIWLRGFLPALLLLIAAYLSTTTMTYWQSAPGTSSRARIMEGAVAYCWDTNNLWRLTPPTKWTLGTGMSINGKRVSLECQWLGWQPRLDEAFAPVVIQSGHIQTPVLCLSVLAAFLPALVLVLRRRRIPAWACRACRYDLRGLPDADPCPECGGQPAITPHAPASAA